jgi:hypothetical protein
MSFNSWSVIRELFFAVGKREMRDTLLEGRDKGLNGLYKSAAIEGYSNLLCSSLDESKFEFVSLRDQEITRLYEHLCLV